MRTHQGDVVDSVQLQGAREQVADQWAENARAIFREDDYARHITRSAKRGFLEQGLAFAEEIRSGQHDGNFTIWQRLNIILTGECVAFLPT